MSIAPAAWMKLRNELRTRWVAWLGLGVLVGIVAGGVIAAAAGARRTASANERFRDDLRAYSLILQPSCEEGDPRRDPKGCRRTVANLPAVADSAAVATFEAFVATEDGRSVQPEATDACFSGPGQVLVAGDRTGRFGTTLNRFRILDGRSADPSRPDEVVVSAAMADRLSIVPGNRLRISMFDGADCMADPSKWRAPITVRVVGVGVAPGEVAPTSGSFFTFVHTTPAFVAQEPVNEDAFALAVRLRETATKRDLMDQMRRLGITSFVISDLHDVSEAIDRGIRPQAVTLALAGALAALAGAVVLGQLLARQTFLDSADHSVLSALGMGRRARAALGTVRAGFIAALATVVAVWVAVMASPMMPIGLARTLEPDPGFSFDGPVLVAGAVATFGFTVLVGGVAAWSLARLPTAGSASVRARRSRVAGTLVRAGAAPSVISGVQMALERSAGRRSAPIATSVVAITLALFTVTAALTFGAGLDQLVRTPRLTGWNWDAAWGVSDADQPLTDARVAAAFRAQPEVEAFAPGTFFSPFPDGLQLRLGTQGIPVGMFSFAGDSAVGPSVIEGRAPRTSRELLVGTETLEELGLALGDAVLARGQAGSWDEPGKKTRANYRIVGTGAIPFTERMGRGATMTLGGVARLNPDLTPDGVFLRVTPGTDTKAVVRAVARRLDITQSADVFFIGTEQRETLSEVRDLGSVDRAPLVFALMMGFVAIAVLVNVLISAVRSQRTDLAVLRAIGFDRRRVRATVATEAATYVLIALAVAVPLGIAAGRVAWLTFADRLRVVPEAPIPWFAALLVVGLTLLVAAVVAVPVAWRVSKRPAADGLRTE